MNVVPIACGSGSMDKAFRLQHTVPFRQASLFVFIARRTHEPLLTGSNVSPPPPIPDFGSLMKSFCFARNVFSLKYFCGNLTHIHTHIYN